MMKAIIFDLDQTLVDSQRIEYLRRSRQWSKVYRSIPEIKVYGGIDNILSILRDIKIKLSIASAGPSSYIQRLVRHFGWSFDAIVCYPDTVQHKPNPEPLIKAANRLNIDVVDCWAVGDDPIDIIAARRADMYSVGALWGSLNKDALRKANPDMMFETTESFYEKICEISKL